MQYVMLETGIANGLVRFTDAEPISPSGNYVQYALALTMMP